MENREVKTEGGAVQAASLNKRQKAERTILGITGAVAGVAFVIVVGMITVNVFCRFFLKRSFPATEEVAYMAFTWATFLGASMLYAKRGLVAIDALVMKLKAKARQIVTVITSILLLVVCIALTYWSIKVMVTTTRLSPNLHLNYRFVYLGMAISFALMAYYSLGFLIATLRGEELEETALEERS